MQHIILFVRIGHESDSTRKILPDLEKCFPFSMPGTTKMQSAAYSLNEFIIVIFVYSCFLEIEAYVTLLQ